MDFTGVFRVDLSGIGDLDFTGIFRRRVEAADLGGIGDLEFTGVRFDLGSTALLDCSSVRFEAVLDFTGVCVVTADLD